PGTWDGPFPLVGNDCPFSAPPDQNHIFPVVITSAPNDQVAVVGADGSQGLGEILSQDQNYKDSFLVTSQEFGIPFNNTSPYVGCTTTYYFGFFTATGSEAQTELRINFENCTDLSTGDTDKSCSVLYAGTADQR